MAEKHPGNEDANARNEGEGKRTAARQYNDAQQRFAHSGQVREKAREAERSLDRDKRALKRAETVGRSHAKAEDPEVKRKY